jgi:hypothetical protein
MRIGKIRVTEARRQLYEAEARAVLADISRWGTRHEIAEARRELRYWSDKSVVTTR